MRTIFYNYQLPFRNLFVDIENIEKISTWNEFREFWDLSEEILIILPVGVFDIIGLDLRFVFRDFGRKNNVRFLLIGTIKQIEFSLTQNEFFLGNIVEHLILPHDFDTLELAILKKVEKLEKIRKGKNLSNK